MRKVICFLIIAGASSGVAQANKTIKIEDYVGGRIESCINNRVTSQDTKQLVEPFRHLTEGTRWQTEFIGKWMLGAIGSYRYNHDAELLQKIKDAAYDLMSTQREDVIIDYNQKPNRLTNMKIW